MGSKVFVPLKVKDEIIGFVSLGYYERFENFNYNDQMFLDRIMVETNKVLDKAIFMEEIRDKYACKVAEVFDKNEEIFGKGILYTFELLLQSGLASREIIRIVTEDFYHTQSLPLKQKLLST